MEQSCSYTQTMIQSVISSLLIVSRFIVEVGSAFYEVTADNRHH